MFYQRKSLVNNIIKINELVIRMNISKLMGMVIFCGYLTYTPTEQLILYYLIQFNFRPINTIFVQFNFSNQLKGERNKCYIFSLQIMISKKYSDTESKLLCNWSRWIKNLDDYKIKVVFP